MYTRVLISEVFTQTWYDANSPEKALCSPDGYHQAKPNFALLDPTEDGVFSARTMSTHFLPYPERGRSGTMILFGEDKNILAANFCKCKQCPQGGNTLMLPYKMRNTNDNNANPLQCGRCEDWIGQYSMPLNRMHYFFTYCEICKDTLCEFF